MRIFLDENEQLLKQLRLLYLQLPLDLRSDKPMIPASELIFEAIEFISMLKTETDFKMEAGESKKKLDPIVILPIRNENSMPLKLSNTMNQIRTFPVSVESRNHTTLPHTISLAPRPNLQTFLPQRPQVPVRLFIRASLSC